MDEQPGLSEGYRRASPWPVFVAFGLAFAEVGVFVGIFPVAVLGLLLFGGSVAGVLTESGYASRPWSPLLYLGGLLAVVGVALIVWQVPLSEVTIANFGENGLLSRAVAVAAAGITMAAAGGVASLADATSA